MHNTPFRSDFVRLKNQIAYSAFNEINSNLTIGKNHYLFDQNYIKAYSGEDLIDSVQEKNWRNEMEVFCKEMKQLNIPVYYILAPNKAKYYNEYLPQYFDVKPKLNTDIIANICKENNINFIDVGAWFYELKPTTEFPLIPKYGAHWSTFGAALVIDSLNKSIKKDIPSLGKVIIGDLTKSTKEKFSDADYIPSLNLIFRWKNTDTLAYPAMIYDKGKLLDAVVVSDSYMWNFFQLDYFKNIFHPSTDFLYYNKAYYNINKDRVADKNDSYSLQTLKNKKAIIIIATGPSLLGKVCYGFAKEINEQILTN
jgi:hypothetical protein